MRQKSGPDRAPAEDAIRDIRRATRRHFSAEDKIRIVLEGLRGEDSIAELCRREGIASSMYYGWSKGFLEAGKKRLAGDTARAATSDEVKDLRREAQALKEVVGDLTLENRLLKKRMARPVCKGFDRERRMISLLQRIRPRRMSPGQDGDTRASVLIKHSASSAAFLTRLPERRSTVRPSRYHHSQTSSIEQRPQALIDQPLRRQGCALGSKPLSAPQHCPGNPGQLVG
jgi:transposase